MVELKNIEEIRGRDTRELKLELQEHRKELFQLHFHGATEAVAKSARFREIRRTVARILTVLGERDRGAEAVPAAKAAAKPAKAAKAKAEAAPKAEAAEKPAKATKAAKPAKGKAAGAAPKAPKAEKADTGSKDTGSKRSGKQ